MYIEETDSTSSLLRRLLTGTESEAEQAMRPCLDEPVPYISTPYQTRGRGQTGNGWESPRGENLLFSFVLRRPPVAIGESFRLSEWVTCVMYDTLLDFLPADKQAGLTIKWPNDIYFGDKKAVGILVENSLQGREIAYSITGIGVNCNQTRWEGNAPNPISLRQIVGRAVNPDAILARYMHQLSTEYAEAITNGTLPDCHAHYMEVLYRRQGFYPYQERTVTVEPTAIVVGENGQAGVFEAEVADITPAGELVLRTRTGEMRRYHFKQVRFVVGPPLTPPKEGDKTSPAQTSPSPSKGGE